MKVAELESIFTADVSDFDKKAAGVETKQKTLDGQRAMLQVDADSSKALASLDRVESAARSIPDATVDVDADTSKAEEELDGFKDKAEGSGGEGGKAFLGGFLGGLAATPIAGAVVGLASDIGSMFVEAFQVEVRGDRLTALTGLDPEVTARLGRAASEAYASNFGDSLDANFNTARIAVQSGLLDPSVTQKAAQQVIQSLSGVADFMEEDVSRVARSTTQLLRTGLAKTAQDAFDIIVRGEQAGLNVSEDWLDTLDEYSTQFRKLGLDGPHAVGLISQGLKAGARDTDTVADALKEFAIRAVDGSKTTVQGFEMIGLSAQDTAAMISAGGDTSAAGLQKTLDGLRSIEDPVQRQIAAVDLFGTKAEDLGDALFALDFDTAASGLDNFSGSASRALATIGDNAAGDIESAQRNIEVAADGIKGALAAAFNPEIEDFSTWVSENREQVMQFLLDLANGALDFARAFVDGTATAVEAVGDFANDVLPALLDAIGSVIEGIDKMLPGDQGAKEWKEWSKGAKQALSDFDESTSNTADVIRTKLIEEGIDPAQEKLNDFAIPLVAQAALHDAGMSMTKDISEVGIAADGSSTQISGFTGVLDTHVAVQRDLDGQLRSVKDAMDRNAESSVAAQESTDDLTASLGEARAELILQLEQMGLTTEQANLLADSYGLIPTDIATKVTLEADTKTAQDQIDAFKSQKIRLTAEISTSGQPVYQTQTGRRLEGQGDILVPMAQGGFSGAEMVKPNTWRIVGDRLDVPEAFIPLDGSARSWGILQETIKRMPGQQLMADGALLSQSRASGGGDTYYDVAVTIPVEDIRGLSDIVEFFQNVRRRTRQKNGVS